MGICGRVAAAPDGFDAKTELNQTTDGTLLTRKTLIRLAGKQVEEDVSLSTGAIKEALRRKR